VRLTPRSCPRSVLVRPFEKELPGIIFALATTAVVVMVVVAMVVLAIVVVAAASMSHVSFSFYFLFIRACSTPGRKRSPMDTRGADGEKGDPELNELSRLPKREGDSKRSCQTAGSEKKIQDIVGRCCHW